MNFYEDLGKYGDDVAIIDSSDLIVTYNELLEKVTIFANHINNTKKSLFFILCKNNIESIVAYLAVLRTNHTAFLISHDIDNQFLNKLISIYRPDYIWSDLQIEGMVVYKYGTHSLTYFPVERAVQIYEELNLLLSTSGSTGSSKLVKLTGANLNANASSIAEYLELSESERPITVLPMNYSYGLSIINSHLLVGSTILLTNKGVMQKEFWQFLDKYKATSLSGVPYTYEMFKKLNLLKMEIPSVTTLTQAGGKLFPSIAKEFAHYAMQKNKKFYIMYGQTEATARISYLPPEYSVEKAGSIGVPIPNGKLYLIEEEGNKIQKPNVAGEMIYQGKNVMLGYALNENDLVKGDENKAVLKTGDLGYFDEDGFFFITGRKNRNIKILGNRINLDEVERVLQSMNFECYVGGEDELLKVAIKDSTMEDEITNFLSKKIHIHPSQVEFLVIKSIPRNQYGKISYAEMFK